jgi:hypothetical protein
MGFDREQSAMFADNVEMMERPKEIVPSFVWFQRFDNVSFDLRKSINKLMPLVLPLANVSAFRKIGNQMSFGCSGKPWRRTSVVARISRLVRRVLTYGGYDHEIWNCQIRVLKLHTHIEPKPVTEAPTQAREMGQVNARLCF